MRLFLIYFSCFELCISGNSLHALSLYQQHGLRIYRTFFIIAQYQIIHWRLMLMMIQLQQKSESTLIKVLRCPESSEQESSKIAGPTHLAHDQSGKRPTVPCLAARSPFVLLGYKQALFYLSQVNNKIQQRSSFQFSEIIFKMFPASSNH